MDQNSKGQRRSTKDGCWRPLFIPSFSTNVRAVSSRSEHLLHFISQCFIYAYTFKFKLLYFIILGQVPLIAAADLKRELETLQYREHKRHAFQGQITAVQYLRSPKTSGVEETEVLDLICT